MTPPDLTQALTSTAKLIEIRDTLRDLHGEAAYERRVAAYREMVEENMRITRRAALDAATDIARLALKGPWAWAANWVLAAGVEVAEGGS